MLNILTQESTSIATQYTRTMVNDGKTPLPPPPPPLPSYIFMILEKISPVVNSQ